MHFILILILMEGLNGRDSRPYYSPLNRLEKSAPEREVDTLLLRVIRVMTVKQSEIFFCPSKRQ